MVITYPLVLFLMNVSPKKSHLLKNLFGWSTLVQERFKNGCWHYSSRYSPWYYMISYWRRLFFWIYRTLFYYGQENSRTGIFKTWNENKKNCYCFYISFWIFCSWSSSLIIQKGGNFKINFCLQSPISTAMNAIYVTFLLQSVVHQHLPIRINCHGNYYDELFIILTSIFSFLILGTIFTYGCVYFIHMLHSLPKEERFMNGKTKTSDKSISSTAV